MSPHQNGFKKFPVAMKTKQKSIALIWHERLRHIGKKRLIEASVAGLEIPGAARQDLRHQQGITCLEAATGKALVYPVDYIAQKPFYLTIQTLPVPLIHRISAITNTSLYSCTMQLAWLPSTSFLLAQNYSRLSLCTRSSSRMSRWAACFVSGYIAQVRTQTPQNST